MTHDEEGSPDLAAQVSEAASAYSERSGTPAADVRRCVQDYLAAQNGLAQAAGKTLYAGVEFDGARIIIHVQHR